MLGILSRSAIIGGIMFAGFVWAFGLPWTWGMFLSTVFAVAVVLVVGGAILTALKWAAILAIVREMMGDDD